MTPHEFTEDQLGEQPALEVLESLGWEVLSGAEEVFGEGGTLGRETPGDVVLVSRLITALRALNPGAPEEAIDAAVETLTRDRSTVSLVGANREVWELLREGIPVTVHDSEHGGERPDRLRVIDWANSAANQFLAVSQLTVTGPISPAARRGRVREWAPAGGAGVQETGPADPAGLRRQPHQLQVGHSPALLAGISLRKLVCTW